MKLNLLKNLRKNGRKLKLNLNLDYLKWENSTNFSKEHLKN